MFRTLGKHRKARGRPFLAWLVIATIVALPAMLQSATPPAEAGQAKRNILPASKGVGLRDPDFPESTGDFAMPGDCGSKNINGGFNIARWTVQSSYGNGSTVWVGDEWTVSIFLNQRWAATSHGNNGPDPLNLEMKPTGPVVNASAPVGEVPKVNQVGVGDIAYEDYDAVGLHTAIGAWGYGFDSNSSPGILETSDGASVKLTIKMKATAEGVITLPKLHVTGWDGTPPAGNVSCDMNIGWKWTVASPLSPVVAGESVKVNASYDNLTPSDATTGNHRFRIPVLANDDDPNIAGGPGDVDQVGIADWQAQSAKGGQVVCGSTKNMPSNGDFDKLGHSCEYQPPAHYAGTDTFLYKVRQKTNGLEKTVPVNITVLGNTAPTAADAESAVAQNTDAAFDLAPLISDAQGDPVTCVGDLVADPFPNVGTVTLNPDCSGQWDNTNGQFTGPVTFKYRVCDTHPTLAAAQMGAGVVKLAGFSSGDLSGTASRRCSTADATIDVSQVVQQKPVGVADVDSVDAGYSGDAVGPYSVVIPVLANDTDGNGPKPTQPTAGLFILSAPDPAMGTAVVQGSNVRFTPADGYEGPVTFTYRVCEDPAAQNPPYNGFGLCGSGKVTVNVLGNDAPDAVDDAFATVNLDTLVNASLDANDSDNTLMTCATDPVSVSAPQKVESLSISPTCDLTLDPVDTATGTVDVDYRICDTHQLTHPAHPANPYGQDGRQPGDLAPRCSVATAAITLIQLEDPPVDPNPQDLDPDPTCGADQATTSTDQDVTIDVLANDTDLDADQKGAPVYLPGPKPGDPGETANGGSFILDPDTNAKIIYLPPAGFTGTDSFEYEAQDELGQGCAATVTVEVDGNDPDPQPDPDPVDDPAPDPAANPTGNPAATGNGTGGTGATGGTGTGTGGTANGTTTSATGTLPTTGTEAARLLGLAALLIAAGTLTVRTARRRS